MNSLLAAAGHLLRPVLAVSSLYPSLAPKFRDGFASLEKKDFRPPWPAGRDIIFHSSDALVLDGFIERLQAQEAAGVLARHGVRRFSCDIGPCFASAAEERGRYLGLGPRLAAGELRELCRRRLERLRSLLPAACELAVEVLPYYDTGAYEDVCLPEFYNEVCAEFSLGLVFDVAHARISARNLGLPWAEFLARFDASRIQEFHLSRPRLEGLGEAVDAHQPPGAAEFDAVAGALAGVSGPARTYDVVIEYYADAGLLADAYAALARHFHEKA